MGAPHERSRRCIISDGPSGEGQTREGRSSAERQSSRIFRYSLITYLSQALGLLTGPLTVRSLGAHGRGLIAEVGIYGTILGLVFTLGVETSIARRAAAQPAERPHLLGAALKITACVTPLALLADGALLLGPLASLPQGEALLSGIILGVVPLGALVYFLQAFLVATGSMGALGWLRTLPTWTTGTLVVVLFAVDQLTLDSYLVVATVAVVAQTAFAWHVAGVRPQRAAPLIPLIKFGLKGSVGSALALVNISLDQAVVGPFVGISQLGYYAVAVSLAGIPSTVAFALAFRSFADVAAPLSKNGEDIGIDEERAAQTAAWIRMTMIVSSVLIIALLLVSPVAIPLLYGRSFGNHVIAPLFLLGPGIAALGVSTTAVNVLVALGRPGASTLIQIPGVALTCIGLAFALPRWGIDGAAAVSSIAYVSVSATALIVLHRMGVKSMLPRRSDLAAAAAEVLPAGRRRPPQLRRRRRS